MKYPLNIASFAYLCSAMGRFPDAGRFHDAVELKSSRKDHRIDVRDYFKFPRDRMIAAQVGDSELLTTCSRHEENSHIYGILAQ